MRRVLLALALGLFLSACGGNEAAVSDGDLFCRAAHKSDFIASCSVDEIKKVIFLAIHTNSHEANKMCSGMLSMSKQVGMTGWRITIRGLSGNTLATCT